MGDTLLPQYYPPQPACGWPRCSAPHRRLGRWAALGMPQQLHGRFYHPLYTQQPLLYLCSQHPAGGWSWRNLSVSPLAAVPTRRAWLGVGDSGDVVPGKCRSRLPGLPPPGLCKSRQMWFRKLQLRHARSSDGFRGNLHFSGCAEKWCFQSENEMETSLPPSLPQQSSVCKVGPLF